MADDGVLNLERVATAADAARDSLRDSNRAATEAGSSIQTAFSSAGAAADEFLTTVRVLETIEPVDDAIEAAPFDDTAKSLSQLRQTAGSASGVLQRGFDDAGDSVRQANTAITVAAENVDRVGLAFDGVSTSVRTAVTSVEALPSASGLSLELKTPDLSQAASQFDSYREAGEAAASATVQNFTHVSSAVETASASFQSGGQSLARFGATTSQIRLPDFRRPAADAKQLGQSADAAGQKIVASAGEADAALRQIAGSVASINAKIPNVGVDVGEQTLKAAEGFQSAGDGALTLARGIAFVTSSSRQGFEEAARKIDTLSAAFDVFRGGIQTVQGVSEGIKGLQTASSAASVAQTALATANTSVSTTAGVARVAMTALNAALGPIGLAVVAIGAAVAGVAAAWKFFSTPAQEPVRQTASALEDVRNLLDDIRDRADLRDLHSQVVLDAVALNRPLAAQERLAAIEQKRLATLDEINRTARSFGSGTIDLVRPGQQSLVRLHEGTGSEDEAEAQRSLAILQLIEEAQQRDLEAKRASLKVLQEQNRVLKDNRQQTVEEWKSARSALEVARQARQEAEQRAQARRNSFAERIGTLNPEQLAQVRRVQAIKDAGGGVSPQDAVLLEEFGITDTFARSARRQAGIAAGALGLERSFGLNFNEGVREVQGRVVREEGRVQAVVNRIAEQLRQAGRGVAEGEEPLAAFVQELTRQVERNRNQQRQHLNEIAGTIERLIDHSSLLGQLDDRLQVLEQQRKLNQL